MAFTDKSQLVTSFSSGKTPTGTDFQNLLDSTYGFPTSASPSQVVVGSFTVTTSAYPVTVNGTTYYIPLFTA